MSMTTTPTRRETGDERKLAIAAAARALIFEKGLEGLRTRDIAERVGINIATLHYHVPSKEALVALVAESLRSAFRAQSMARPRDGKSALQLLHMEFEDFRETALDTPELLIVLTELMERARRDSAIEAIIAPLYLYWRQQFVEIFRAGAADGSFRPDLDPLAAALITTGALSDYGRNRPDGHGALDGLIAELERCFINPPISSQG